MNLLDGAEIRDHSGAVIARSMGAMAEAGFVGREMRTTTTMKARLATRTPASIFCVTSCGPLLCIRVVGARISASCIGSAMA